MDKFFISFFSLVFVITIIIFSLAFLGIAVYIGAFVIILFAAYTLFIFGRNKVMGWWQQKDPSKRCCRGNIIEIDGVEIILPEDYISKKTNHSKKGKQND